MAIITITISIGGKSYRACQIFFYTSMTFSRFMLAIFVSTISKQNENTGDTHHPHTLNLDSRTNPGVFANK